MKRQFSLIMPSARTAKFIAEGFFVFCLVSHPHFGFTG